MGRWPYELCNVVALYYVHKYGNENIVPCTRWRSVHLAIMLAVTHTFNFAGIKIHHAIQGVGEPVILIHGLHSSSRINWDLSGTTRMLADYFQVVTMDCRGHGQSDKPEAEDAYGIN